MSLLASIESITSDWRSIFAGGPGSGRHKDPAVSKLSKNTLNDKKLLKIQKKPWGKRTEEEHHYVARHDPRQRSLFAAKEKQWIGVDFDGTLIKDGHYPVLGPPVPKMVQYVKELLKEGAHVKVFTARADKPSQVALIQRWTKKYLGVTLEVTNKKDYLLKRIIDDKANVKKNTGIIQAGGPGSGRHPELSFWLKDNKLKDHPIFKTGDAYHGRKGDDIKDVVKNGLGGGKGKLFISPFFDDSEYYAKEGSEAESDRNASKRIGIVYKLKVDPKSLGSPEQAERYYITTDHVDPNDIDWQRTAMNYPEGFFNRSATAKENAISDTLRIARNRQALGLDVSTGKPKIKAGGPGSGRHPGFGKPKLNYWGKPILTAQQKIALEHSNPARKEKQDAGALGERLVRDSVGGVQSADNKPYDVFTKDGKHAIEVKTLVDQKNDKITMGKKALGRKLSYVSKFGVKPHTVVLDMRGSTNGQPVAVYHKAGVGSFRVGSMDKVKNGLLGLKTKIQRS